ncbi:putative ribonuclease H-like domain-containing protein [Tanacetum coccineum]|uniref:Ribonuclease H-like domain-containing protein n=1 Tax=Tanacetum coccineum TaxID=301880 RepID=A0ABQ5HV10_9ASTR
MARPDFIIAHYAGEVHYQSDQFLDKNKDYIVPEHQDLLSASKCSFVAWLFPPPREDATKSSKFSSIGSRFKGVLEAIRIGCVGYPTYKSFADFVSRFWPSSSTCFVGECINSHDKKDGCRQILNKAGMRGYQGSEDFHQIIDFLNLSHIKYALTENPTIYTLLIQQFWETTSASTSKNEEMEITATIDGRVKTITEASIRRHLKLEDSDGILTLPNPEIFEQLALMGYASDSDKLTIQKGHFLPQWRFLIHTVLHYLSPKKTAWEQFNSNIATAIICLATNRTFNFSKIIFEGILKNLDSRTYVAPTLTQKLFSNMRRVSMGYTGVDIPLFPTMLTAPESSPSRITSSPSLSPQTHPSTSQQPPIPPFMQTIHDTEEPATMPHDPSQPRKVEDLQNDLKQTKLTYGAAYTKLILRVKKLKHKILLEQEEPTKLVEDPGSGEKGEKEISTAEVLVSTASAIPKVSTAIPERQVYIRRSVEKRKDKGKAIMKDDESLDEREEVVSEADPAQVIDWSDPVNQGGYKHSHFKGMSYEDIRPIFERVWDQNQSFVPKDSEIEKEVMKRSGFDFQKPPAKRQKVGEVSESNIHWEILTEESRSYWRIIRVGNHTEVYQIFKDMLKRFDRDDLEKLWDLVKKKFSSTEPTVDKKVLWVELKRLFKPDDNDTLWKLQRYMHDPLT